MVFTKSNVDEGICKGWKELEMRMFWDTIFEKSIFTNYESHHMTITTTLFWGNLIVLNTKITIFLAYLDRKVEIGENTLPYPCCSNQLTEDFPYKCQKSFFFVFLAFNLGNQNFDFSSRSQIIWKKGGGQQPAKCEFDPQMKIFSWNLKLQSK